MRKHLIIIVALFMCCMSINAQNVLGGPNKNITLLSEQELALRSKLDSLNAQLPFKISKEIEFSKVYMESRNVILVFGVDENVMKFDALKGNEATMKNSMRQVMLNKSETYRPLLSGLSQAGYGLQIMFHSLTSTNCLTMEFSQEEVKDLLMVESVAPNLEAQLANNLNISNLRCPVVLDEATTLISVEKDAKNVVYNYTIKEDEISIAFIKKIKKEFNAAILMEMIQQSRSAVSAQFYKLVVGTGRGIKYHYVGDQSGKIYDYMVTNKQLKNILLVP